MEGKGEKSVVNARGDASKGGRGRRLPLGLCLRGVGGGGASCGVCFSSRITRYVIVRVAKVVQDRGW